MSRTSYALCAIAIAAVGVLVAANQSIMFKISVGTDISDDASQTAFLSAVNSVLEDLGIPSGSLAVQMAVEPQALVDRTITQNGKSFCMCPSLNEKPSGCPFSCAPTEIPTAQPPASSLIRSCLIFASNICLSSSFR